MMIKKIELVIANKQFKKSGLTIASLAMTLLLSGGLYFVGAQSVTLKAYAANALCGTNSVIGCGYFGGLGHSNSGLGGNIVCPSLTIDINCNPPDPICKISPGGDPICSPTFTQSPPVKACFGPSDIRCNPPDPVYHGDSIK
jgi:hypothetical protein